ncbi:hypothetical protein VU01_14491, partial [Candidatus Electrothrix marina]
MTGILVRNISREARRFFVFDSGNLFFLYRKLYRFALKKNRRRLQEGISDCSTGLSVVKIVLEKQSACSFGCQRRLHHQFIEYMKNIFADTGLLAECLPNYESRSGQLEMAEAIA